MQISEQWRPVPGYELLYKVSSFGRVRNFRGRLIAPNIDRDGYVMFHAHRNKTRKAFKVHRLVLLTFIGSNKLEVNHIDGDKRNNRLENLEYSTRVKNAIHAHKIGLCKSKTSPDAVSMVKRAIKLAMHPKEIRKMYGINADTYSNIASGSCWSYVH